MFIGQLQQRVDAVSGKKRTDKPYHGKNWKLFKYGEWGKKNSKKTNGSRYKTHNQALGNKRANFISVL